MSNRAFAVGLASLVCCSAAAAFGAPVIFEFAGALTQVSGPGGLAVGDGFTGSFSFTREQVGTDVPLVIPGRMTRYGLSSLGVMINGQSATSTGGTLDIANDNVPFANYPSIIWDTVDLDVGPEAGGVVLGSMNGCPVARLMFSLLSLDGQPFSDTSLPANLALDDFPALRQIQVIFADGEGAAIGDVTSLQLIPEPGALSLFALGGAGLVGGFGRRAGLLPFGQSRRT